MKKQLLFTVCILLFGSGFAQTQFWSDNFEDSGAPSSGARTPSVENSSGGPPATRYFWRCGTANVSLVSAYTNIEGSKFWAGEDHRLSPISQSAHQNVTWSSINISGKTGLSFKGMFASGPPNFDIPPSSPVTDYVIVEYRIDGGAWQSGLRFFPYNPTIATYLSLETTGDSVGEGVTLLNSANFTEFNFNIAGTGNTLDLRLKAHSNGTSEEWAVDNFRLFETAACTAPVITANPPNRSICVNGNTTFTASATGATAYQWQVNTGSGFTDIANGGVYSNATTNTLTITGATSTMNGYQYRCTAINGVASCFTNTNSATLTISNITSSTAQNNVACFGQSTGSAAVSPNGGIGSYTYSWSPSGGTASIATGLAAGAYTVTITDAIGCQITKNFTITQPPTLNLTASSQTNVACNGGATGAATVNVATGGAGGYTYDWTPGNPTGDGTVSVTGLTAGTWTCTVSDANSCTKTVNFTITQPPALSLTPASQTNIACNGGATGAASVNTATGGAGGYTYNWTPGNPTGDGTTSVTGLTAGTWTCTVMDANACTASTNFTITQPASAVSGTTVVTNVACFGGNTGAINLTPTGGTGPYTFNWASGPTTEDRTNLTAGTYSVTITDANGCTGTVNATVTQPTSAVSGSTVVTNVACFGGNTGTINLTPTGGVGPYTFSWVSGPTTEDRTNLTAGTYSVTITDANGCTGTVNATITQSTAISLTAASQTNVSCNGGSNGAAAVNAATGGAGGYTYNWTPGNPTGDGTVSVTGLTAGTWTCTVTDANACTASVNFTVTQPTAISLTAASQTNVSCNGGSNGAAAVNAATGGAGGYTYNWTPGNPTGDGTVSVTGLTAGTWTCTVTDANACTASVNFTVTQPTALNTTAGSKTDVSCNGGSNGTATVSPTGGTPGYTYSWAPTGGTGGTATGLAAGTYTVTVTDANACTGTKSFTITEPTILNVSAGSQTNVSCNGGSNGTATVSPTGGTPGYTYSWAPTGGTGGTATGLAAGTYTVTVTDANGCQANQSFTITEPTALNASMGSQVDVLCNGAATGSATVLPVGGTPGYTYLWSPTGGNGGTESGLTAGTYTVTVTDANGCQDTKTFIITESAPITSSFSHTACATYTWGTQTHTTSGVYTQVFTAANGCDSTVTLTLTINPTVTSTVVESSCNSYTWAQNGMTYTVSGMYVDTIASAAGCDSIVTLDLTINTPTTSSSSEFACGTYTWAQNGMTYTTSGVYTDTIPNAAGCDSIITLVLTIGGSSSTESVTACGSYTWAQNGMTYTNTGMYSDTLTDVNGCDSILVLDLTILAAPVATATDNGNATITASAGTSYQWINCTSGAPIAGATAQTFAASANGSYAVIVTNANECSDTSNCVNITNVGISENTISTISVHPNPTHDVVIVTMDASSAIVEVMDVQGKLVQTTQIKSGDQVDLSAYERGVYTLRIKTDSGTSIERIVKN